MEVETQICKLALACDGKTPKPLTEFHYLKRYGRHDYGCKACRNYQQRQRRTHATPPHRPKHALYHSGFNELAHAFCFGKKRIETP